MISQVDHASSVRAREKGRAHSRSRSQSPNKGQAYDGDRSKSRNRSHSLEIYNKAPPVREWSLVHSSYKLAMEQKLQSSPPLQRPSAVSPRRSWRRRPRNHCNLPYLPLHRQASRLIHGTHLYLVHKWYLKTTWTYLAVPVCLYARERTLRLSRSGFYVVRLLKVASYPGNVLALQISKPPRFRYKNGQYMFVQCPAISLCEWHRFSITSAPGDDFLSIHIRQGRR